MEQGRYYLNQIGINHESTPQGWNKNDNRQSTSWKDQKERYGFDERETWELNYSLKLWLYERLSMYNEVNIVDTNYHQFEFKGELITLQNCIDKMIEGLKLDLTLDEYSEERKDKKIENKINDVFPILSLCLNYLWW